MLNSLYPLCVCFAGDEERDLENTKRRQNERAELEERRVRKRQVNVLLLGAGESGKTTFTKQMLLIHGPGKFSAEELHKYRQIIYQNIVGGMQVLLDARDKLDISWENSDLTVYALHLLKLTKDYVRSIGEESFHELAPLIQELWEDGSIREAFERRSSFQISENCKYFFDNIDRISTLDYVPTNADILLCRKDTKRISEPTEHLYFIQKVPFRFIDVGGQRSQRQKWIEVFEGVTSVLFFVGTSEYDQYAHQYDPPRNRLSESREIFETIVNHYALRKACMILFLNKEDLLKEKVRNGAINRDVFKSFVGKDGNLEDVKRFMLTYFLSAVRQDKNLTPMGEIVEPRDVYHHWTTAVNTENIRTVFNDTKETILHKNLGDLNLL